MKTINVTFEDEEFDFLARAKGSLSWRDFILKLVKKGKEEKSKEETEA